MMGLVVPLKRVNLIHVVNMPSTWVPHTPRVENSEVP